jgi:hypothetical protein
VNAIRLRRFIKRASIAMYCRGALSFRVVVWLFATFKLRSL